MTASVVFAVIVNVLHHSGLRFKVAGGRVETAEVILSPSFGIKGTLCVADDPYRTMLPMPEAIFFVVNHEGKVVKSLADLRGLVTIGSAAQAIAFARLTTHIEFGYLIGGTSMYEIVSPSQVNVSFAAGLASRLPYYRSLFSGCAGLVTDDWLRRARLPPLKITSIPSGWRIERNVVYETKRDVFEVRRLTEMIGRDEAYAVSGVRLKPATTAQFPLGWIHYPRQE